MTPAPVAQAHLPMRFYRHLLSSARATRKGHAPVAAADCRGRLFRYLSLALLAVFLLVLAAPVVPAQDSKSQLRTVRGVVSEKTSEAPVASAVVFLKNTRNNDVRSYISDLEGNYRFSGLDPNIDYEVHAEKDGAKSATRTVSSFDSKKEIVLNLKLAKSK